MNKILTDNISIQGHSHKLINKECQDNSTSWSSCLSNKNYYSGLIVCDGHGGDKYFRSAIGSKIATEIGKEFIHIFMQKLDNAKIIITEKNFDEYASRLEKSIIEEWNERVTKHYKENSFDFDPKFTELEDNDKKSLIKNYFKAYGTTFVSAVLKNDSCYVFKLGDGNVNLISRDGSIYDLKELEDEQLEFNITTSMCGDDADLSFKHCFISYNNLNRIAKKKKKCECIILTSDGIINCYDDIKKYKKLIKNICSSYKEDNIELAKTELIKTLEILSEKGSGDDLSVSIAIIK